MPKGPRGGKRPADVVSNAVRVARLAVGDEAEELKDPNAQALGSKGGRARMRKLSPERRKEIAQQAAAARWAKS